MTEPQRWFPLVSWEESALDTWTGCLRGRVTCTHSCFCHCVPSSITCFVLFPSLTLGFIFLFFTLFFLKNCIKSFLLVS